jgi:Ca-activated chloride channel family protein
MSTLTELDQESNHAGQQTEPSLVPTEKTNGIGRWFLIGSGRRATRSAGDPQPAPKGRSSEVSMWRRIRGPLLLLLGSLVLTLVVVPLFLTPCACGQTASAAAPGAGGSGSLQIVGKDGKAQNFCPLKHTDVRAGISGFLARVTVTQVFENTAADKIEAIYTFPLPQDAAVDDMTIQVGSRTVRGLIKRREEARAIYEKAKQTGHVAALLDQERPNIFTQSVANIMPGEQITVTISYVETLRYEAGSYEFVFPMVVGPRYIPGRPTGKQAGGWAPDTDKVPDASRITPPVTPKGTRAGHDISLDLQIDAGVPIQDLRSSSHEIDVTSTGASSATIRLRNAAEIPNKDFILKYDVAGAEIDDAVLTTPAPKGSKLPGGYFTLILQPPARLPESDITPKELVFVVDTSGSMWGFPLDKAKELINKALDELYPGDTFNLITFSGDTQILFPEPVFPTAENIRKAKALLANREGGGGTEMMKAIRASLAPSDAQDHVRIVCFVTDGYVGDDMEIIGEIQKHTNARVFAFGIGNSVNRFLLDNMAKAGRGAVEYVTLADKADEAAHRLYERLRSPLLTDVSIDWGGLPVTDVYPQRVPDLFSGQPVIITGRYTKPGSGTVRLKGMRAGGAFSRDIAVNFDGNIPRFDALPGFWARQRIEDLMFQDMPGLQSGAIKKDIQEQITQLGLDYRLMTQFTSFVAVEEKVVTVGGQPKTVQVPVEMPEGVDREHVFGEDDKQASFGAHTAGLAMYKTSNAGVFRRQGVSGGVAGGVGTRATGGAMSPATIPAPPPPPPLPSQAESVKDEAGAQVPGLPATPERKRLESKLQPALLAVFDCSKKRSGGACPGSQDGKVEVQVWFTQLSDTLREQLKALGFEPTSDGKARNAMTGKIPLEKLESLTQLTEVKFVSLSSTRRIT